MTDLTTIKDALVRATDETEAAEREYHLYRFGRGELLEAWTDLNDAMRRKDWQIMGLYDLDALDQAVHEAAQALMPLEAKKRALMQEAQRTRANLKSRVRRLVAKDWTDEEWTFLEESVQRANAVKHGIIQRDEPEPEPEAVSETVSEPALEITSPEQLSQVLQELLENEETRTETVAGLLQRFPEDDILRLACMYLTNQDGFAEWLNKYVWERRTETYPEREVVSVLAPEPEVQKVPGSGDVSVVMTPCAGGECEHCVRRDAEGEEHDV